MNKDTILTELRDYLVTERLDGASDGLDADTPILELGLIDSLSMLGLLAFIESRFGVAVPDSEVRPENFYSLAVLSEFLARLAAAPASRPEPAKENAS